MSEHTGGTVTQPEQPDKMLLTFTLTEDEQPYCWPDTDDPGIDFDALPIGTEVYDCDGNLFVRFARGWSARIEGPRRSTLDPMWGPYTVVYQPAPLSPGECLRGLLAGRDDADADELIKMAAKAYTDDRTVGPLRRLLIAVGDAAREARG